jgi:hypothetical protein
MKNIRKRRSAALGFTLIEFLAFIAMVACMLAGARIMHDRISGKFGWLLGGVLGVLAFFLFLLVLTALMDFGFGGVPRLPKCQNGSCCGPGFLFGDGDYEISKLGEKYVRVCRCGGRYMRLGKRFVIVNEDGTKTPYLIWRPFRGWFPDKGPTIQ